MVLKFEKLLITNCSGKSVSEVQICMLGQTKTSIEWILIYYFIELIFFYENLSDFFHKIWTECFQDGLRIHSK